MLGRIAFSNLFNFNGAPGGLYNLRLWTSPYLASAFDFYRMVPLVIEQEQMPYSVDSLGEAYPDGTKFVLLSVDETAPYIVKSTGATMDLSFGGALILYLRLRRLYAFYFAYGIEPAATGVITVKWHTSGVTIGTVTVHGSDGAQQIVALPGVGPAATDSPDITVVWSGGGAPISQGTVMHPFSIGHFVAVPGELPDDYTYRSGGDDQGYQIIQTDRQCGLPWSRLAGPYQTPGNWGLGAAGRDRTYLIDGELKSLANWWPAVDQDTQTLQLGYAADIVIPFPPFYAPVPPPVDNRSFTTAGWRQARLVIDPPLGAPGVSVTFTVTRSDTGAVTTRTYTSAQIVAGVNDPLGAFESTSHVPFYLTFHVNPLGHPYFGAFFLAKLKLSPTCSVPLPFTAVNEYGSVAPGGVIASTLTDMVNDVPPVYLDPGVTTYTPEDIGIPVAFKIAADGWYSVICNSANIRGVGEDDFNWGAYSTSGGSEIRELDRGHANRPFWAYTNTTLFAAVLTAYTPVFTLIDDGGTAIELTKGKVWGFGRIEFPAAGTYEVRITCDNVATRNRGLVFEWSTTGTDCVNVDGSASWEAVPGNIGVYGFEDVLSTPPAVPDSDFTYVVGANATGDWAGHEDDIVSWSDYIGEWVFLTPVAGMTVVNDIDDDLWQFYDGHEWHPLFDPVIIQRFTVDEPTTVYCSFGPYESRFATATDTPQITVSWGVPDDS